MMKPKRLILSVTDPKHPEQLPDEMFIGNSNDKMWNTTKWKTKRRGKIAYRQLDFLKDGTLIPIDNVGIYPTFIKITEYEEYQQQRFVKEEGDTAYGKIKKVKFRIGDK